MSLIQFTQNYSDLSTDQGYQFKFFCDKCRNGYMSSFQASVLGMGSSLLKAASGMFGGVLGSAGNSAYQVQRAVGSKAHDSALQKAVEEMKAHFHQCKRCSKWVCPENCWNAQRGMCTNCAPDVQSELAAAQVQATLEQIRTKVRQQDMTKDLDLAGTAAALCPKCGARVNGKFCGECGTTVAGGATCASCGTSAAAGVKFCPKCGKPMGSPKCPGCGKQFETPPKFCDDCGTKMA